MKKLNVVIVDDHSLFRRGLKLLLSNFSNILEIFEAGNGNEFLDLLGRTPVDIALMDIDMPGMNGIEATRRATADYPDTRIIALSMYGDEAYYYQMIDAGVKGFILKDSDITEVKNAIDSVAEGNNYFSAEILYKVVRNFKKTSKITEPDPVLTERELEVLYLICRGLSNQEIADKLFVSKRTVDKHRENLLIRTNSKNTACLVIYAIKNKLVEI
ncbi:MAG: response regulator transcription factor [Bacteroidetes bacterium]|nr:response regulator transcription factor [Bacteroidota bacterium]